jgi:protein gp37
MGKPSLEVADVFREFGEEYRKQASTLFPEERRVMDDIINCRTAALGGHVDECDACGHPVVGGESGPKARRMDSAWVIEIRDQCLEAGVPFFFKQWGKLLNNPDRADPTAKRNGGKTKGGRMLEGRTWNEDPVEG